MISIPDCGQDTNRWFHFLRNQTATNHYRMSPPHLTKAFKWLLVFLVIDLLCSFIWSAYIIKKTKSFTKLTDLHAVVILMGDFTNNYKGLGPETLKRLNFALSLHNDLSIDNYLCVGGSRPTENIVGADLMKEYLVQKGISPVHVYADGNSFDTRGNWADALQLIEQKNWKTIGVISSAFHLYRFKEYIAPTNEEIQVSLIPFPYDRSTPKTTLANLWISIHYEWLTYALYAMPEPVYDMIVSLLRPQQVSPQNT
ncbi:YdcF family protein [Desulfopila sp. IMCC35008]|uniref:YdcF family protein n=1 Tax=Desulfopila sp. IMCC35008 TaxID=2653858 RepID=UPI0013D5147C|nr:YdcF family protein [Desulfopila sp. IMCC35008]